MHFTVYNGFNCPIPHNISLYQKNENNEPINLVMLDFTNNSTEFVEFNNMPTVNIVLLIQAKLVHHFEWIRIVISGPILPWKNWKIWMPRRKIPTY